jgi:flagellar hook-associated protein 1
MSTFSGLSTSLRAMQAQRQALDVTGQNIANAGTVGYTRQRAELQSVGPASGPALYATSSAAGGGVTVASVARLGDSLLDARARAAEGEAATLSQRSSALTRVESLVAEPSDDGLSAQLAQLWAGWSDVANRPEDSAARTAVLAYGADVATTLNDLSRGVSRQWDDARTDLTAVAAQATATAASVAELNGAIQRLRTAGSPANELADQRDALVLELATLVGATAREGEHGVVDVSVGGTMLVRGTTAGGLAVAGGASLATAASSPVTLVSTGADGGRVSVTAGRAGGLVETLGATLPGYAARFDAFAADLAGAVNAVHSAGRTVAGTAGGPFFSGTTASTLAVAVAAPEDLAAADAAGGPLDGSNADRMSRLGSGVGGPDASWRTLVTDLGVAAQSATRRAQVQDVVRSQTVAAREANAGVNLDEELANMLTFQRAYEGAARMLTAVDAALDTLINRTGLVGR